MASEDLTATVLGQVMTLSLRITGQMRDGLEELGLTEPLAQLLWILDPAADPQPMRKLATLMACDPSNITLLSAKLEERGLVSRQPHPRDGRVRVLVLTADGHTLRARLLTMVARRSPLAALTADEHRQLRSLLSRALGGLR